MPTRILSTSRPLPARHGAVQSTTSERSNDANEWSAAVQEGQEGNDDDDVSKWVVAARDWVPSASALTPDPAVNAHDKPSLRTNQTNDNKTKCSLVLKRSKDRFPMYVPRDVTKLALKFGIIGGTNNPSLELSLRAGIVTKRILPDQGTITLLK
jgi:hypothetical protein